jgi:hypothetical protein
MSEFDETCEIPDQPKRDQDPKVALAIPNEIPTATLANCRKSTDMLADDVISNGLSQNQSPKGRNLQRLG